MAEIQGAQELMDISAAHIDSTIYMGEANLEFAERLAESGAQVVVPTTLNVTGLDEQNWREWAVPEDWARNAHRQMVAYEKMGCFPTWTCTPYQSEYKPVFGQQIAWGESNAIAFANSIIGARTERYPDLLDICAAITGRVPAVGLHLPENRAGEIYIKLIDIPLELQREDSFYPVFGHLLGKLAGSRIPVVQGLEVQPSEDQFKAMCAPAASSGAIALFHIVGVTPEAESLEAAFQGKKPSEVFEIDFETLRKARDELTTARGDKVDLVVLGGPHFSLAEFQSLVPLIEGRRRHPDVRFNVTTNRATAVLAEKAGFLQPVLEFGGQLTLDTCILASPMLPPEVKVLMTNSGKFAYYAPGLLNTVVVFADLADCVKSAVEGKVVREEGVWTK
jgi:predicted aconitase